MDMVNDQDRMMAGWQGVTGCSGNPNVIRNHSSVLSSISSPKCWSLCMELVGVIYLGKNKGSQNLPRKNKGFQNFWLFWWKYSGRVFPFKNDRPLTCDFSRWGNKTWAQIFFTNRKGAARNGKKSGFEVYFPVRDGSKFMGYPDRDHRQGAGGRGEDILSKKIRRRRLFNKGVKRFFSNKKGGRRFFFEKK